MLPRLCLLSGLIPLVWNSQSPSERTGLCPSLRCRSLQSPVTSGLSSPPYSRYTQIKATHHPLPYRLALASGHPTFLFNDVLCTGTVGLTLFAVSIQLRNLTLACLYVCFPPQKVMVWLMYVMTFCFCLTWQFNQFILLVQALIIYAMDCADFLTTTQVVQ